VRSHSSREVLKYVLNRDACSDKAGLAASYAEQVRSRIYARSQLHDLLDDYGLSTRTFVGVATTKHRDQV
jgi:hypothetical protein